MSSLASQVKKFAVESEHLQSVLQQLASEPEHLATTLQEQARQAQQKRELVLSQVQAVAPKIEQLSQSFQQCSSVMEKGTEQTGSHFDAFGKDLAGRVSEVTQSLQTLEKGGDFLRQGLLDGAKALDQAGHQQETSLAQALTALEKLAQSVDQAVTTLSKTSDDLDNALTGIEKELGIQTNELQGFYKTLAGKLQTQSDEMRSHLTKASKALAGELATLSSDTIGKVIKEQQNKVTEKIQTEMKKQLEDMAKHFTSEGVVYCSGKVKKATTDSSETQKLLEHLVSDLKSRGNLGKMVKRGIADAHKVLAKAATFGILG